jgi:hypothetical protein
LEYSPKVPARPFPKLRVLGREWLSYLFPNRGGWPQQIQEYVEGKTVSNSRSIVNCLAKHKAIILKGKKVDVTSATSLKSRILQAITTMAIVALVEGERADDAQLRTLAQTNLILTKFLDRLINERIVPA